MIEYALPPPGGMIGLRVAASTVMLFCLAGCAATDIRTRRIPNWLVAALLLATIVSLAVDPAVAWMSHLVAAVVAFVLGAWAFHAQWVGGGDAKLFAVIVFGIGLTDLSLFLLVTAGCSVVISVLALVRLPRGHEGAAARALGVPFGVPLAVGAAICILT